MGLQYWEEVFSCFFFFLTRFEGGPKLGEKRARSHLGFTVESSLPLQNQPSRCWVDIPPHLVPSPRKADCSPAGLALLSLSESRGLAAALGPNQAGTACKEATPGSPRPAQRLPGSKCLLNFLLWLGTPTPRKGGAALATPPQPCS